MIRHIQSTVAWKNPKDAGWSDRPVPLLSSSRECLFACSLLSPRVFANSYRNGGNPGGEQLDSIALEARQQFRAPPPPDQRMRCLTSAQTSTQRSYWVTWRLIQTLVFYFIIFYFFTADFVLFAMLFFGYRVACSNCFCTQEKHRKVALICSSLYSRSAANWNYHISPNTDKYWSRILLIPVFL